MKLEKPKSDNAEILKALIDGKKVDCISFSWMEGFRTRISNLRLIHGVRTEFKTISKKNRFGHPINYRRHYLPTGEKRNAIRVYQKLNAA